MTSCVGTTRVGVEYAIGNHLELDPAICAARLGQSPMRLLHHFSYHPLLALEAVAKLADSLPITAIECLSGSQEVIAPGGESLPLSRPSETVLGIESNGCWMVMKNVERNPQYRLLLNEVLDELAPMMPAQEGRMGIREAFLFLSAPGSVTPVHIDPEHNALLHVRGTKSISVGKFVDEVSEQREIKRYVGGGHRNLVEIPSHFKSYLLLPGEGIYMPPWRPHWVKNGPTYSLSLSIAFRTRRSERLEYTHMVNRKLEQLGLSPIPPGVSAWRDALKASYVTGKRWLRRNAGPRQDTRSY